MKLIRTYQLNALHHRQLKASFILLPKKCATLSAGVHAIVMFQISRASILK